MTYEQVADAIKNKKKLIYHYSEDCDIVLDLGDRSYVYDFVNVWGDYRVEEQLGRWLSVDYCGTGDNLDNWYWLDQLALLGGDGKN